MNRGDVERRAVRSICRTALLSVHYIHMVTHPKDISQLLISIDVENIQKLGWLQSQPSQLAQLLHYRQELEVQISLTQLLKLELCL